MRVSEGEGTRTIRERDQDDTRANETPSHESAAAARRMDEFLARPGPAAQAQRIELLTSTAQTNAASPVQSAEARDDDARTKMDATRERYAGPYRVSGEQVRAEPMFRMNGGFNGESAKAHKAKLGEICVKLGLGHAEGMLQCGRATPDQLVKVTQALIDQGHLPPGAAPVADRIKHMQWEWGIGLDCVGYSWQACKDAQGAAGRFALDDTKGARVGDLPLHNFVKHPVAAARAGDILRLKNPNPKQVGHNVVVYRNELLNAMTRKNLETNGAGAFLSGGGPYQVMEVDSSWGAGEYGSVQGGVRRDTWVLDTSSGSWGFFDATSGAFQTSEVGPQGEIAVGSFRPRGAQ
jgi:hypothetical protein